MRANPTRPRHPSITPFDVFRAQDGWFVIAAGNDALFRKLCAVLDLQALIADARFLTNDSRCLHQEALKALIERQLASAPCAQWQALLLRNDIPTGPYNDLAAVLADPQIRSRDMLMQVQARNGRSLTVAASPVHVGAHRTPLLRQPPQLDQDRQAILAGIQGCGRCPHKAS